MRRIILILTVIIISLLNLNSQSFLTNDDFLINGFSKKIAGLDFEYHSCIPGLRESLLLRTTSGKDFIEWETDIVPLKITNKYATFIWVAAIGSSPGKARMDLTVNGKDNYTFYTDGLKQWEVKSADGSILSFNSIMVDQHGDNHGYMTLRIPFEKVTPGKPLLLKVTGSQSNLTSWYMTFKKEVKTGVTLNSFPAILKTGTGQTQLVEAAIFYFGKQSDAKIYANGNLIKNTVLNFGYNAVNLP